MNRTYGFLISENAKSIQTASFEVPSNCARICIRHNIPKNQALLVTMVVLDNRDRVRLQKQLGYSEPILGIGKKKSETSIGGIPGTIEPGMWTIKLYIATEHLMKYVDGQQISFEVNITDDSKLKIKEHVGKDVWVNKKFIYTQYNTKKVYQTDTRWYKGDFHTHTRLSDGKETPERAMEKARGMNLDFYVATEHNVLHTGWPETDVMVVPGVEITTSMGHANLFGLRKRPKFMDDILKYHSHKKMLPKLWKRIGNWCCKKDVLLSVNHPFLYIWKWEYDELPLCQISCLEIVNDPTYESVQVAYAKEANELAIQLSDVLWEDGYRICAIGGSDSHNEIDEFYEGATEPSIPGDPATWIYLKKLKPKLLKDALVEGCSCVTRYVDDLKVNLYVDMKKIYPGGKMHTNSKSIRWEIMLKCMEHKPSLFVLINGVRKELNLSTMDGQHYEGEGYIELPEEDYCWIRFGAEGEKKEFMLYVNPVTRGMKQHSLVTFGDAKERLRK